jgi:hypothetical protein
MASHLKNLNTLTKAISDPAALYVSPENVLSDQRLNDAEKFKILDSWALDQKRLMESEEENMTQISGERISAAAMFQKIKDVMRELPEQNT